MARFHINKHGVPAPCRATKGNCPLGGEGKHFDTREAAQEFADSQNEKESSLLPISGGKSGITFSQDESKQVVDGYNVEKEEKYPQVFDRHAGEYHDYFQNIDSISPEEAKEVAAYGIVQGLIEKRNLGDDGLRGELDAWNEGSMEYALEDSADFVSVGLVGGALDMPDKEDEYGKRVREELEMSITAAEVYIDNVNSGMSPKEAQLAVEKMVMNDVSKYFNPGNGMSFDEDGIPPLKKIGEEMSEGEIKQAGQLFENVVSRDKAYRFMGDSGGYDGEVLSVEQRKIFGSSSDKKDKIGSTAMDAAKMFYHSPLYGGSINTGKNIREMRGRYEDWLRTDGQKSE